MLSSPAKAAFEAAAEAGDPVYVTTITLVEIIYLTEKGNLPARMPSTALDALAGEIRFVRFAAQPVEFLDGAALPKLR